MARGGGVAPFAVSKGTDGGPSNGELRIVTARKMSGRISAAQDATGVSAKHCPLVALQGHPAEPLFHVFGHFLLQSAPNYKNRRLRINWRGSCMSGWRKTTT